MGLGERQEFIRVRVTKVQKDAIERRAKAAGKTISDFLREIIDNNISEIGHADALAHRKLELLIQIGLMSSKMMDKILGDKEAMEIRELSKRRASEMVNQVLDEAGLKRGR